MQMEMRNALLGVRAPIHDRPEPRAGDPFPGSDTGRRASDAAHQHLMLRIDLVETRNVDARNHQHVDRRLWIDIPEGDDVFILEHDVRRDLARHDLAEETIGHGSV